MQKGRVIAAIGGFFDVDIEGLVLRCGVRGKVKEDTGRILVGDRVQITSLDEKKGVIEEVFPRKTELFRPAIANVEQVVVIIAAAKPRPILLLVDRLLVLAERQGLGAVLVVNKWELDEKKAQEIARDYQKSGYTVILTSALLKQGLEVLTQVLTNKVSTFAGPSGVGKSSLLNGLEPSLVLDVGDISAKLLRGKHTTRKVQLFPLSFGGYVADTPGFSQLSLDHVALQELPQCFPEFLPLRANCQFRGCLHHKEPLCAVKDAVKNGGIALHRYEHYLGFLQEIQAVTPRY